MSENHAAPPLGEALVLQLETVRQLDMDELDPVHGGAEIIHMSEHANCTGGVLCKPTGG